MDTPSIGETKQLLAEAETLNPGPWVARSIFKAEAARFSTLGLQPQKSPHPPRRLIFLPRPRQA